MTAVPTVKHLADYRPYPYEIRSVDLSFDLFEEYAIVEATSIFCLKDDFSRSEPLVLSGEEMELVDIALNKQEVVSQNYEKNEHSLTLSNLPAGPFSLVIKTRIYPHKNTNLSGLYRSNGMFCTQCEAEGFRRITYFPDRPDVTTSYRCSIQADKQRYPVLLSNGNRLSYRELGERHGATWEDPHRKPSYLFALVAGDLVCLRDYFTTKSGRKVTLEIYTETENEAKCDHAMLALQKSMKWDEEVFGLEYDLDIYMIVAVNDFNMGAMENKGLNIFNASLCLATPETATDTDYQNIEGVIAHEYFHNWTGNRITLRDWFQLSLKEGLTVFRDEEYTSDSFSRAAKRIEDVSIIRKHQFAEDAGPMSHPIRPETYIEINNFYTVTVYNKGAEVIRVLYTLIGRSAFFEGMKIYVAKHDGDSAQAEDFIAAMEEASQKDLSLFKLWYSQAGTPRIALQQTYDPEKKQLTLDLEQSLTKGTNVMEPRPMHIPLRLSLFDEKGKKLPLIQKLGEASTATEILLEITEKHTTFTFFDIQSPPKISVNRQFSAPVIISPDFSDVDLLFLLAHDDDSFNRWDAAQKLFEKMILRRYHSPEEKISPDLIAALQLVLQDQRLDPELKSLTFIVPSEMEIGALLPTIDIERMYFARRRFITELAEQLEENFLSVYRKSVSGEKYRFDSQEMARRSLNATALSWYALNEKQRAIDLAFEQYNRSNNMTDRLSALRTLNRIESPERDRALAVFYEKYENDALVLDKWFALQAICPLPDALERVKTLTKHEKFSLTNPNRVRAVVSSFCSGNILNFHQDNGKGYEFLADNITQINRINSQMAARLSTIFSRWKRHVPTRQEKMRSAMESILTEKQLSPDVYEIISKTLKP